MKHPDMSSIIKRLAENKKLERTVYVIIFASALIIFALSGGISCGKEEAEGRTDNTGGSLDATTRSIKETEEALEEILSAIDGAGRVKVMITMEQEESRYASDYNRSEQSAGIEARDYSLLGSENVAGGSQSCKRRIGGVIVAAEGADDLAVRARLMDAVKTLLGINADRIGVYAMKP